MFVEHNPSWPAGSNTALTLITEALCGGLYCRCSMAHQNASGIVKVCVRCHCVFNRVLMLVRMSDQVRFHPTECEYRDLLRASCV
jgi:hypothetical protein